MKLLLEQWEIVWSHGTSQLSVAKLQLFQYTHSKTPPERIDSVRAGNNDQPTTITYPNIP